MGNLEQQLNDFCKKNLPILSQSAKETATKVIPWLIIVFSGLGILSWLSLARFFFGLSGMMRAAGYVGPDVLATVYFILSPIMAVLGLYGGYLMLSRQLKGWRIAFYSLLIGLIANICYISVFGIFLDLVFGYFLFQIRDNFMENA